MGRNTTVTYDGHTYEVPDIWLATFCRRNRCTVVDAMAWWHQQEMMEAAWQAQQETEMAA